MDKVGKGLCEILLVEDNPGDVLLVYEAFDECGFSHNINTISSGDKVLQYLKQKDTAMPDMIILDLNLPRKNGKDILREIKNDEELEAIPVIILTSSEAESDVSACYKLKANCYIKKPVDFDHFMDVIKTIEKFWVSIVTLPPKKKKTAQ